jgi:hypothetical protein
MSQASSAAWHAVLGQVVVLDLASPFVCIGMLAEVGVNFIVLVDADVHDLRDTQLNREQYVVKCRQFGPVPNRARVWIAQSEIVAFCRLEDVRID